MPEIAYDEDGEPIRENPLRVGYSIAALGEISFLLAPKEADDEN